MDRPLKEITLPSGKKARIVTYLLRGEAKEIERQRWKDAKVEQKEDGQISIVGVPVDQKIIQDDALVSVAVKWIKDGEEETTVITRELLDNLSDGDFNFILNAITTALTEKKSQPKK
jgi:predicted DNA-binding antitoxin AbrB/MazE fold protein